MLPSTLGDRPTGWEEAWKSTALYKKVEGMARIVLRPLASPLPLAFFAFGAGSLMLSSLQLGLIPASENRSVAIVQAAFVFPPMVLSSVLAFLSRETLGATIMALISVSWLANGLIDLATPPTSTNATQGLLVLALAAILLLVGAGAVFSNSCSPSSSPQPRPASPLPAATS